MSGNFEKKLIKLAIAPGRLSSSLVCNEKELKFDSIVEKKVVLRRGVT